MSGTTMNRAVDRTFDNLLSRLGCVDGTDAVLISHWQDAPRGFRIQVARQADGVTLTQFVDATGAVSA